jgi:hypothetical protein
MNRSHIYEVLQVYESFGDEFPSYTAKVIKDEYRSVWQDFLTPEEKAKHDSLSNIEQLIVSLSNNPFVALGAEE